MSRPPSVISHHAVRKCPPPSSVTQPPFKNSSNVFLNNSLLCSEERLSSTGTLVRVWMKWNSMKTKKKTLNKSITTIGKRQINGQSEINRSRPDLKKLLCLFLYNHIIKIYFG